MDQKVELSRKTFVAMLAVLIISLMGVAFLLGRQTAVPVAQPFPSSRSDSSAVQLAQSDPTAESAEEAIGSSQALVRGAVPTRRERPANTRELAIPTHLTGQPRTSSRPSAQLGTDSQVETVPQAAAPARVGRASPPPASAARPAAPPSRPPARKPAAPSPPADSAAVRRYFSQLDNALAGTQSMGDANAFATELLQQSMQGDSSGFDQLLASSQEAFEEISAIQAPPACQEHHRLMMGQLRDGIGMLKQVRGATTSMDTSGLAALAGQGRGMQAEAARLQELDQKLRAGL